MRKIRFQPWIFLEKNKNLECGQSDQFSGWVAVICQEANGEKGQRRMKESTMVQNSLIFQHLIIHFSMSLGVCERASAQMSEASGAEQANE